MKRNVFIFCLILFVTGLAAAQVKAGGILYVSVKTLTLKSGTGFFASNRGTLNYGDQVTVIRINGNFAEVKSAANSSLTGWTATTNLSVKQIVTGSSSTATAKEVSIAGKGFNREIEDSYKNQKSNLNYADVDNAEAVVVREEDIKRFLEEGRLRMGDN
ncbi:SH3 domain-containing protein [Treponema sp. R80B11-R83G3]